MAANTEYPSAFRAIGPPQRNLSNHEFMQWMVILIHLLKTIWQEYQHDKNNFVDKKFDHSL